MWRQKTLESDVKGWSMHWKVNPYPAKSIYLNFQPLEVVSCYRDPQLQVAENYSYLFNLGTNICKSWCSDTRFIHNNSDLVD